MGPNVEIAIGGRKTDATLEKIQLPKLHLDPLNVRFKHLEREISENDIERHIWEEEDAKTLYKQIKIAGGLMEPPVVIQSSDKQYLVKEGNRRVVCLRKLSKDAHEGRFTKEGYSYSKDHFDEVQCIVLPTNLSQKDIDSLIGTRHVSGPREWATLNRAWYIYEMYTRDNMDYEEIRQILGFGKGTIIRMVKAFEKTIDYGKKHPEDKSWFRKFTYFDELFKKPELRQWIDSDSANTTAFIEWVASGKFDDVRDVRILPEVLNDVDANKVFRSNSGKIASAREVLSHKDPSITSQTFATIKKTIETLRNIPRSEFVETTHDPSRLRLLSELRKEVDSILEDVDKLKTKQ